MYGELYAGRPRGVFQTLAPQFPEVADNQLIPLEYVLFVNNEYFDGEVWGQVNRWQLGRLVDRIHLLGTVRLATLLYLPHLRHAGEMLSLLDSRIIAAREAIDPNLEESVPQRSRTRTIPVCRMRRPAGSNKKNKMYSSIWKLCIACLQG
jgi:hypothetical protein